MTRIAVQIHPQLADYGRIRDTVMRAEEMGADAVVNIRFTTSQVMAGAAEMLAYGTAVKLEPSP